jgi:hypothetical protein
MNRIVYVEDQSGTIGLVDADGSNPVTINAYPSGSNVSIENPVLSSDGSMVLFSQEPTCMPSAFSGCNINLSTILVDGTGLANVPRPPVSEPACIGGFALSPDGTRIAVAAYAGAPTGGIWTEALNGSNPIQVTSAVNLNPSDGSPTWSPDGGQIAFDRNGQVYTVSSNGGPVHQLTHLLPGLSANEARWSPDGQSIAFQAVSTGTPPAATTVMTVNVIAGNVSSLFARPYPGNSVSWAPDSAHLVTTGSNLHVGSILIVNLAGQVTASTGVTGNEPSWITPQGLPRAASGVVGLSATLNGVGYRMATSDGGILTYGNGAYYGGMGGTPLNKPVVALNSTVKGAGYWEVASDGGIFSFGDATYFGSMGGRPLNRPIVGMASNPSGNGYWEVASDGGIFSFGDATFYGSMGGRPLNSPIVGMAATSTGEGYWLVASDGGIFSFGDATFDGSMGGMPLNEPVVGMATTPHGKGYWLTASDGGVFSYGDATFYGSTGGLHLNEPVVEMASVPQGGGYWLVASDGGVFSFGTAGFFGSKA